MRIHLVNWVSLVVFALWLGISPVSAQKEVSHVLVSRSQLKNHVYLLASDSLQGRLTGSFGQQQAATYCLNSFRSNRLIPVFRIDSTRRSLRQRYPFSATEVAIFGSQNPGHIGPSTYRKLELLPPSAYAQDSSRILFGDNIGGLIMGTDLKQQVVVLSAHYDHLGSVGKSVFHGADDNASGTAAILSIASTFDSLAQLGIRSRRSILFVLFSGEEGGLIGSQYFVANSPIPLKQLVCDLNVDMVGRVDFEHRKKRDYCYTITGYQRTDLQKIAKRANESSVRLAINKGGYNTKEDYERYFYRSDHYNFAKQGIPILFFLDGEHPDYHQTTDTADKIDYNVLQKRAKLVFQTTWLVANPTF